MSQGMPTTDVFESHLENGRSAVLEARQTYSNVHLTRDIPDKVVEGIGDLEQEIDELDKTLDVTEQDIQLAEQAEERAGILASIFEAFELYQQRVVEADLGRLQVHASALTELRGEAEFADSIDSQFEQLSRQLSMLEKLAENGRYGKMVSNDRVSLATVEVNLRKLEKKLINEISPDSQQRIYLMACDTLLDEIHETLLDLHDSNEAKTAFSPDLNTVKGLINESEAEETNIEKAAKNARVALEGVLMLHYTISREGANQYLVEELEQTVPAAKLDCDVKDAVLKADVDTLLDAIGEFVGTQSNRTSSERIAQLLKEHDGSVVQTIESTDYDRETVITEVIRLIEQQRISDINVVFSS